MVINSLCIRFDELWVLVFNKHFYICFHLTCPANMRILTLIFLLCSVGCSDICVPFHLSYLYLSLSSFHTLNFISVFVYFFPIVFGVGSIQTCAICSFSLSFFSLSFLFYFYFYLFLLSFSLSFALKRWI